MSDQPDQAAARFPQPPLRRPPIAREIAREAIDAKALAEHKRAVRGMWAAGDYSAVAARELWPLGKRIIERVGVRPGERVLDVACGTGNAAIRAAQAGGRVVGLDLTPELLEAARRRAAEAGVEVEWVQGDAEALPFANESFDVVVSILGVMFAPRHELAARELARVLRPGGRIALCNWTTDARISQVFRTVGRYLPPPPELASPPALWGAEEHVRSLFAGSGIELRCERGSLAFPPFDSPAADVEFHSTKVGPLVAARALTEANGRWPALRAELEAIHDRLTSEEYLLVLGHKRDAGDEER